jgi:group I intron endonuclease
LKHMLDIKKSGVYSITNLFTHEMYIGSCISKIDNRFRAHRHHLRLNTHGNKKLQNSWNKYKENNFVFLPIENVDPKKCIEREQFWIDTLSPDFNLLRIAGSRFGLKFTKEAKIKMSNAKKGKFKSIETRNKMRINGRWTGKHLPASMRNKISSSKQGAKNPLSKPIKCIELNKNFESIRLAGKYIRDNINPKAESSNIAQCCRGIRSSAYNFTWEYLI